MGNSSSIPFGQSDITYTVPVDVPGVTDTPEWKESRSEVYRVATHPSEVVKDLVEGGIDNCYEIFQRGCRTSRTRPCLGRRKKTVIDGKEVNGEYEWWSYAEVEAMSRMLGSGLLDRDIVELNEFPEEQYEPARRLRTIGICSKNKLEWFVLEQTANAYSLTLVPLYDTLGDEAIRQMVQVTKMSCIAGATENMVKVMALFDGREDNSWASCLKYLICFDPVDSNMQAKAEALGLKTHYWVDLMDHGKDQGLKPLQLPSRESVNTICFTSGTTGVPKGAIITHGAIAANICGALRGPFADSNLSVTYNDCYISYLPLAHVLERLLINVMYIQGSHIAIYSGDPKTLLDDIKVARPTIFASVPRLFMRINDRINAGVQENSAVARFLFNTALETKIERLRASGQVTHRLWDKLVFDKIKMLMGGRLRYMISGGAALDLSVQERMAVLFCCPLLEGYGLTETMGGTFLRKVNDKVYGHVGAPLPCAETCLESVPEMGYFANEANPKGELLIRGPTVTPGYFLYPEGTKAAFTEDGWFHTGDIAVRLSDQGGRIKIIDRKKNMFKLAQGEYVAAERIEAVYAQCQLISQVYVTGDSSHAALVAIVCVDEEELAKWVKNQKNLELEKQLAAGNIANSPELYDTVQAQMKERETSLGLLGFEKVRAFKLESEQFSVENDLLTPTFKLKRHMIQKKYQAAIDTMFAKTN